MSALLITTRQTATRRPPRGEMSSCVTPALTAVGDGGEGRGRGGGKGGEGKEGFGEGRGAGGGG